MISLTENLGGQKCSDICHGAAYGREALTLTDYLVNHALEITGFSVFLDVSVGGKI